MHGPCTISSERHIDLNAHVYYCLCAQVAIADHLIMHELLNHYIALSVISNLDKSYEMIRTILYEINRFVSDIDVYHVYMSH